MILVFYLLQIGLLGILSYQDWRTKNVSLFLLTLFVIVTILGLGDFHFPTHPEMVFTVLGLLIFIKTVAFLGWGKNIMGNGDLILLLPLLMSLYLEELSLFLIIAGLGGILTTRILREERVPFVPSLSVAYILVLMMRLVLP